jgi:transaldolase
MENLLDQLKKMTIVVSDTGDIKSIEKFKPRDATTNPSLLTAAAQMPEYQEIVDAVLGWARSRAGARATRDEIVRVAIDRLAVEFGRRILDIVPKRVSTEVDARLSYDTQASIDKARTLIGYYEEMKVPRERVLIKLASTWEGIRAAEELEKEGIHCNMTLLFGLHQAVASAEAGATLISPFVGRILDWFKKSTGRDSYPPAEDPGVISVTKIYNYFKRFEYRTEVMGASFRNIGEITELAGCDLLTIAPNLLADLAERTGELPRKLDPDRAKAAPIERIPVDKASFDRMHAADAMASEKLAEGIQGFSKALAALEKLLGERLDALTSGRRGAVARDLFKVFDLDGDGAITREEWAGLSNVFDALDADHDGRITPQEMAAGLGAAFRLDD